MQNLGQSREQQSCYLFQAVIEEETYRGVRTILNGIYIKSGCKSIGRDTGYRHKSMHNDKSNG